MIYKVIMYPSPMETLVKAQSPEEAREIAAEAFMNYYDNELPHLMELVDVGYETVETEVRR